MFNRFICWLANSPFRRLVSRSVVVVRYNGRRSGKPYAVPVNYVIREHDGSRRLWITSARDRVWWRNFMGGGKAELLLNGEILSVELYAVLDPNSVEEGLIEYLAGNPRAAKYFNVKLDDAGVPEKNDLRNAAENRVMVYADL